MNRIRLPSWTASVTTTSTVPTRTRSPGATAIVSCPVRRRTSAATPCGASTGTSAGSISQRGQVEVVVVRVRDEDRVEARREVGDREEPAEVEDPSAQHRIGEQPGAVDLDQGRGVTHVGQEAARRRDRLRAQRGRHTWMMSRIEMIPTTWPSCTTTRWRKPPCAIASAASLRSQSASANVARAVR